MKNNEINNTNKRGFRKITPSRREKIRNHFLDKACFFKEILQHDPENAKKFARVLGMIFKEHRTKYFLTQAEVSQVLGVTPQQYQKFEVGVSVMNAWQLFVLSRFFAIDDLFKTFELYLNELN